MDNRRYWSSRKRRKTSSPLHPSAPSRLTADDDDDDSTSIPFVLPKMLGAARTRVYSSMNHVHFNDDITEESAFALNRELQMVKTHQTLHAISHGIPIDTIPIYLHITTNGGCIHSAFTIVDTIKQLGIPVYTVVTGFVASAGTLISLAGTKRFISANAYMLIHELRSGVWGKMSSIVEEFTNLKKVMDHITTYYADNTKLKQKQLEKLLAMDIIWNAQESIAKGVADELYTL